MGRPEYAHLRFRKKPHLILFVEGFHSGKPTSQFEVILYADLAPLFRWSPIRQLSFSKLIEAKGSSAGATDQVRIGIDPNVEFSGRCAWIVPENVASGDLSDSGISKLRISNAGCNKFEKS